MRRAPLLRLSFNWSLPPEDPRQPQIIELDVIARLAGKAEAAVKELVRKGLVPTVSPHRKGQRYRFVLKRVLELLKDEDWQRQADEITSALWFRGNAHNRKRSAKKHEDKKSQNNEGRRVGSTEAHQS